MRCRVLFFAQLAEQVGERDVDIELNDDASVADALNVICEQYEAVASMREHVAVAVDERYAQPTALLHDGATIALIPPVSGG